MCEELLLSGADIIKVGIGLEFVCITRKKTGVNVKLFNVMSSATAIEKHAVYLPRVERQNKSSLIRTLVLRML